MEMEKSDVAHAADDDDERHFHLSSIMPKKDEGSTFNIVLEHYLRRRTYVQIHSSTIFLHTYVIFPSFIFNLPRGSWIFDFDFST